MTYIVFDIGGTKTRVATTNDFETFGKVESFKTPMKFEEGMEKTIELIDKLVEGEVEGIAGGIRGRLSEEKDGIDNDGVLTKWAGKSIVDALKKKYKVPVFLENDSAVAGLGEATYGGGKDMEIVAYHTVSTGVGGVRIVNEEIDEASIGFEPGHQILDIDRTILGDDITPTLENLVSGTAVAERFGCKAYEIPQSDIIWQELAGYLAQGLRNTILYWSPDAIVLGGPMIIGDPKIMVDDVRKATVEAIDGFVETPLIVEAVLGDEAGLYGAMAILKKRI
ncbi:MAG: ROK family protein [Candidatus Pacebacteria bacterium]|nr:ROK family protein [Candidatus Paceibacterota bacterium]